MRAGRQQHEGSVQGWPHPFPTPAGESGRGSGAISVRGSCGRGILGAVAAQFLYGGGGRAVAPEAGHRGEAHRCGCGAGGWTEGDLPAPASLGMDAAAAVVGCWAGGAAVVAGAVG